MEDNTDQNGMPKAVKYNIGMKSSLIKHHRRKISELEDMVIETLQTKAQRENRLERN